MSSYFEWDPARLGLQIREMDDEHKVLIDSMNKLHAARERRAAVGEQLRILDELVTFTRKHFADEEAYMERIGFPGLRTHRGVHAQLLNKLAQFQSVGREKHALPEELFAFFKMWLSAHIRGIDVKYAEHAKTAKSA